MEAKLNQCQLLLKNPTHLFYLLYFNLAGVTLLAQEKSLKCRPRVEKLEAGL